MLKTLRLKADEAEEMLLKSGFVHIRTKGSHRIYRKEKIRVVVLYHTEKILHPKIVNRF